MVIRRCNSARDRVALLRGHRRMRTSHACRREQNGGDCRLRWAGRPLHVALVRRPSANIHACGSHCALHAHGSPSSSAAVTGLVCITQVLASHGRATPLWAHRGWRRHLDGAARPSASHATPFGFSASLLRSLQLLIMLSRSLPLPIFTVTASSPHSPLTFTTSDSFRARPSPPVLLLHSSFQPWRPS